MKADRIVIPLLAAGLAFAAYRSSTTYRSGAGVCSTSFALGLLNSASSVQKISYKRDSVIAPEWHLADLNGKTVNLSDFKGKVVVLNFWATWCPPCRNEIPTFVALQKQYADKGLVIIGASLDQGGSKTVKPFVEKLGINYSVVLADQKAIDAYGGVQVVPTTFVIDRQGNIAAEYAGDTDRDVFEREIKSLL
jgi:cytochrome c biogenesis protein CcmG/thiol:disulfide interchange protein DsbE